jgi:signal transduction histidine kinase
MNPSNRCRDAEEILMGCVHDLRQPLGTIETSAFVLSLMLGDTGGQVPEHLRTIERQVELAARTLTDAVAELRRIRAPRTDTSVIEFMDSEPAAVR